MSLYDSFRDNTLIQNIFSFVFKRRFESGQTECIGEIPIPYRLYIPNSYNVNKNQNYPIILTLHGAGRRGYDNQKQIYNSALFYSSDYVQQIEQCFVLAPQCPPKLSWSDITSWSEGARPLRNITIPLKISINLLNNIIDEYRIDRNRQIVTGFSMGGYGTWDAIVRFPDRFEAAVPISGGGIPAKADRLNSVRVWAFHGAKDTTVPVEGTRRMIEAMREAGLDSRYTEFESGGHTARPVLKQQGLAQWIFNPNLIFPDI